MFLASALLGPWLDNFHGQFGTLVYAHPVMLGGSRGAPWLITDYWVPPLFGIAGVLITALLFAAEQAFDERRPAPRWSTIWSGVALFSLQYYASGYLDGVQAPLPVIHAILAAWALLGVRYLDRSKVLDACSHLCTLKVCARATGMRSSRRGDSRRRDVRGIRLDQYTTLVLVHPRRLPGSA
jgi:hypothetical protein